MNIWNFLVNLLLIVGIIQLVAAVGLRFYVKSTPDILMRRVSPEDAKSIVADYLDGFEETRLGFPTGFFTLKERTADGAMNFVEMRSSSMGWRASMTVIKVPLSVGAAIGGAIGGFLGSFSDDEGGGGFLGVIIGGFIGLTLAFFLFPMVIGATLLEVVLKQLTQSQIQVMTRVADDDQLDSVVGLKLRGPSALLSEKLILSAFEKPSLPPSLNIFAGSSAV